MLKKLIAAGGILWAVSGTSQAVLIDFTGGSAHMTNGSTVVTQANGSLYGNVDYYDESGFRVGAIGSSGEYVGSYYGTNPATLLPDDVFHGHFDGDLSAITLTRIGGGLFDLDSFVITSNTSVGGGNATGAERAYVEAWLGGTMLYSQLLPSDNWGWSGNPLISLGSQFNAVDMVRFTASNVFCFGVDNLTVTAAPVPEPRLTDLL